MEREQPCRIEATQGRLIYRTERKPLLHKRPKVFSHPETRGETTVGALKKQAYEPEPRFNQAKRELPPADYDDEVTDAQLEAARKKVGNEFDDWVIVDGPAW